jgi:acetolactate synthase-1/2/3 large subunit
LKVSDYIASYLAGKNVKHAFEVTGGAVMHLVHSLVTTEGITNIPMAHEQGCALAADGYSRVTGNIGVAMATSGPGATNLITGLCSSYYDKVPTIMITANVPSNKLAYQIPGLRQLGAQECDIVTPIKNYTSYATQILNKDDIPYELDKAYSIAISTQLPVLVDIPEDISRMDIDISSIKKYVPDYTNSCNVDFTNTIRLIGESTRPVILLGKGACNPIVREYVYNAGIPYATTWPALHYFNSNDTNNLGAFGVHGSRCANYAIQNSDLIISLGARLESKIGNPTKFAPLAKKIVCIDDSTEIGKFKLLNMSVDESLCCKTEDMISSIRRINGKNISKWITYTTTLRDKYRYNNLCSVGFNPYSVLHNLSKVMDDDAVVAVDTGCTLAWAHQAMVMSGNQLMFHAYNFTPMGYSLPASIGARYATNKQVISISGDGGFMMNSQELSTIAAGNLDIKIIVMANDGYGMIKGTQDEWLDSNYDGSDIDHGLRFPKWGILANAYDIPCYTISDTVGIASISKYVNQDGPVMIVVDTHGYYTIEPKAKAGTPIDRQQQTLSEEEHNNNTWRK